MNELYNVSVTASTTLSPLLRLPVTVSLLKSPGGLKAALALEEDDIAVAVAVAGIVKEVGTEEAEGPSSNKRTILLSGDVGEYVLLVD